MISFLKFRDCFIVGMSAYTFYALSSDKFNILKLNVKFMLHYLRVVGNLFMYTLEMEKNTYYILHSSNKCRLLVNSNNG